MNYMPTAMAPSRKSTYIVNSNFSLPSSGKYSATSDDYIAKFYSLLSKWRSENYFVSSPTKLQSHKSFKDIVEMGDVVIPLILSELREKPSLIMMALSKISGEIPYTESEKGNISMMADAWLSWGQRQGYDC